jgi:hypothetical protein
VSAWAATWLAAPCGCKHEKLMDSHRQLAGSWRAGLVSGVALPLVCAEGCLPACPPACLPGSAHVSFSCPWRRPVVVAGERPVRGHQRQPLVPEECPQVCCCCCCDGSWRVFSASHSGTLVHVTRRSGWFVAGLCCRALLLCRICLSRPRKLQEAADLMVECGSLDPLARPTAQQLMQRLAALAAANRRRRC